MVFLNIIPPKPSKSNSNLVQLNQYSSMIIDSDRQSCLLSRYNNDFTRKFEMIIKQYGKETGCDR